MSPCLASSKFWPILASHFFWKKLRFSKPPILNIFFQKFHGLVLGLVQFFVFLGHFWAYVGQPQGHIGWAKSMPFASFNPTNPRTNPVDFHKKYWELAINLEYTDNFYPNISLAWMKNLTENICQTTTSRNSQKCSQPFS